MCQTGRPTLWPHHLPCLLLAPLGFSGEVGSGGMSAHSSPPFLSQTLLLKTLPALSGSSQGLWSPTGWSCIWSCGAPFSLCPPIPCALCPHSGTPSCRAAFPADWLHFVSSTWPHCAVLGAHAQALAETGTQDAPGPPHGLLEASADPKGGPRASELLGADSEWAGPSPSSKGHLALSGSGLRGQGCGAEKRAHCEVPEQQKDLQTQPSVAFKGLLFVWKLGSRIKICQMSARHTDIDIPTLKLPCSK